MFFDCKLFFTAERLVHRSKSQEKKSSCRNTYGSKKKPLIFCPPFNWCLYCFFCCKNTDFCRIMLIFWCTIYNSFFTIFKFDILYSIITKPEFLLAFLLVRQIKT